MRFFCTIFRIFYTLVEIQAFVFPITAPFLYIKSFSGWFDVFYLYINLDTKDYGSMIMGLENINIKDMIYKLIMKWKNGDDAWWTTRCTSSTRIFIFDFGTTVTPHLQPNSVRIELHLEILSIKYEFHFAYKYWIGATYTCIIRLGFVWNLYFSIMYYYVYKSSKPLLLFIYQKTRDWMTWWTCDV